MLKFHGQTKLGWHCCWRSRSALRPCVYAAGLAVTTLSRSIFTGRSQNMSKVIAIVGMGPGVSAAAARRFGREGYSVAAIARRPEALNAAVTELQNAGLTAAAYPADAGDADALAAALAMVKTELGLVDVLLFNAAGIRHKPLAQLMTGELMADLAVSVGGALTAAQAVLPDMRERGRGTLLFTGGGFAMEPAPDYATVGIGKAALRNLAFSLFADLKDTGVHAATVTIGGFVKTGTNWILTESPTYFGKRINSTPRVSNVSW